MEQPFSYQGGGSWMVAGGVWLILIDLARNVSDILLKVALNTIKPN